MGTHPSNFGRINLKTRLNPDAYRNELMKWSDHPVENISWLEVCGVKNSRGGFLGKLNGSGSLDAHFHLPTEAQWEYACRAGVAECSRDIWSGGIHEDSGGRLEGVAWYFRNSSGMTHPVGMRQANSFGLTDMLGNVWEWCADFYGKFPGSAVIDPAGPVSGLCRVLRGGSWANDAYRCRVAGRDYNDPTYKNDVLGLRLILQPIS
jgi:formylglycine-generating enzyme required for sulfatase activity